MGLCGPSFLIALKITINYKICHTLVILFVVSYILYGKRNIVNKHILAGRMASIEVEITE